MGGHFVEWIKDGWMDTSVGWWFVLVVFCFCPQPDPNVGTRRMKAHVCPRSCPVGSFGSFSFDSFCFSCPRLGPWRARKSRRMPRPRQSFGSFCFSCPRPGLKVARARIAQNALGLAQVLFSSPAPMWLSALGRAEVFSHISTNVSHTHTVAARTSARGDKYARWRHARARG